MRRLTLISFALSLLPVIAMAENKEIYTDSETNIVYEINLDEGTAIVSYSQFASGDIIIPSHILEHEYPVIAIGNQAFASNAGITSVYVPSSIIKIGDFAFSSCVNLKSVELNEGLSIISSQAFEYCSSLKMIICPKSLKEISNFAFEGCSQLENITMQEGLTKIGYEAFQDCVQLNEVTIPNSVVSLHSGCFKNCSNLKKVVLGSNTQYVLYPSSGFGSDLNESPFVGCTAIEELYIDSNLGYAGIPVDNLKTLTFGDHVTEVDNISDSGDGIRQDFANLESVTFGKNVKTIGYHSFINSPKLGNVVFPEGLESIEPLAFRNCTNLTFELPESLIEIGEEAFCDCKSLKKVTISGGISRIEDMAFAGCSQLEQLVVKEGVEEIGRYTFGACESLKDISLPEGLLILDGSAFANCYALAEITIPSTVVAMVEGTFANTNLQKVTSYIEDPFEFESIAFSHEDGPDNWVFNTTATLYVPDGTKAKYEETPYWYLFPRIVEMSENKELGSVEEETEITFPTNENTQNIVVGNVYYNLSGNDGFYPTEECIVINTTTNISDVANGTPGSEDVQLYFSGLILQVSGKGVIDLDCQTLGVSKLNVKVGSLEPTAFSKSERGTVQLSYDVTKPTYVYIYATGTGASTPRRVYAEWNCIKLWSLTVKPGATLGISQTRASASTDGRYYTLDGRRLSSRSSLPGLYVVDGKKCLLR